MNCKFFVTISLFVMIFISAIATDVSGDVCATFQDSDGMVYEVVNTGGIYFLRTKVDQFTKRDNNPCSGISSAFIGLQVELTRIATNGTYPALTDYDMPYVSLDNYALLNISSAKINGTSIDIDPIIKK